MLKEPAAAIKAINTVAPPGEGSAGYGQSRARRLLSRDLTAAAMIEERDDDKSGSKRQESNVCDQSPGTDTGARVLFGSVCSACLESVTCC